MQILRGPFHGITKPGNIGPQFHDCSVMTWSKLRSMEHLLVFFFDERKQVWIQNDTRLLTDIFWLFSNIHFPLYFMVFPYCWFIMFHLCQVGGRVRGFSLDGQWLGDSSKILADHERKNVLPLEGLDINDAVPWWKTNWSWFVSVIRVIRVNWVIGRTSSSSSSSSSSSVSSWWRSWWSSWGRHHDEYDVFAYSNQVPDLIEI